MTLADHRVWLRLLHHRNRKTGQCNPTYPTLAKETDLCRDSVIVAIKHLEAFGLVSIRQDRDRSGKLRNQYDLAGHT
jgi:DNA-binding transcriptional MocR family regulator